MTTTLAHLRRALRLAAFLLVCAAPAAAQTTVLWNQYWVQSPAISLQSGIDPYPLPEYYHSLHRLSPTRYALLGSLNTRDTTNRYWRVTAYQPLLTTLTLSGDSGRQQIYPQAQPFRLREFRYAAPAHQPGRFIGALPYDINYFVFPSSSLYTADSTGFLLYELDTTGRCWSHFYRPDPGFSGSYHRYEYKGRTAVDLPDGRLALFAEDKVVNGGAAINDDVVALRVDRQGRERRRWSSAWYHSDYLRSIQPMPDGSYLAVGSIGGHDPAGGAPGSPLNYWLVRFSARGDTLRTKHFGIPRSLETANDVRPTPDGGYLLTGWRAPADPYADPDDQGQNAEVVKLDSTWQEEWHYHFNGFPQFGPNADLMDARPTTDGGYVLLGSRTPDGRDTIQVVIRRLNAAGQLLWQKVVGPVPGSPFLGALYPDWVYEADGTALLMARTYQLLNRPAGTYVQWGTLLTKLSGLPTPWEPNFCARPPAPPAAAHTQPTPAAFVFTADSTTAAGPRYAVLSLCTWDWGDGAPLDTGWVGHHQYLTADPVRVRQCVTNNLFCQTCTDHFPLGPLGLAQELAASVTVWPNPSAGGVFTLRAEPGAAYYITDAVGRTVAANRTQNPETPLDLRAHAAGLYTLSLTWPDGRAVRKRLMRQ